MRARRRLATLIALVLALNVAELPLSQAAVVSNGSCSVNVGSSTGVVLVNSGGSCYLAFSATGSNSFTVPSGTTSSELLVVAGGGAGGAGAWGGGGGAGAVLYSSNYPLTAGATLNISVGAGGSAGTKSLTETANRSNNGGDSWVNTSSSFVAKGGGAGASFAFYASDPTYANGANGGSGGGATEYSAGGSGGTSTQTNPTYLTTKYVNAGGNTPGLNTTSGAGGGGAGAAGTAVTQSGLAGDGGAGTNAFSSWFTAIGQFGVTGYIAGGGGGGSGTTAGNGGLGGGGKGGGNTNYNGTSAIDNTGGGGGGASYSGGSYDAGNGGSGLIIFKFTAYVAPVVLGTPSVSGNLVKGGTVTLSITSDSQGTITFFINNKRIAGCIRRTMTGTAPSLTSTCQWKPSIQGVHQIRGTVYPTNLSQSQQSSSTVVVKIGRRSNLR